MKKIRKNNLNGRSRQQKHAKKGKFTAKTNEHQQNKNQ